MTIRERMKRLLGEAGVPVSPHILHCKVCKTTVRVDVKGYGSPPPEATQEAFDKVKAKGGEPSFTWPTKPDFFELRCHGKLMANKPIKGTYSKDVPCGPKCLAATGPNCVCQCGGRHHGAGHA